MRLRLHALALLLLIAASGGAFAQAPPGAPVPIAGPETIFLGPVADHFVDRDGALSIAEVAGDAGLFTPANGRVANRGVSPTPRTAFWLRFTIPDTIDRTLSWVAYVEESRVLRAVLYVPTSDGFRPSEWNPRLDAEAGRPLIRYPAFRMDGAEVAGKVVYLRIETVSSMRAMLWLKSGQAFAAFYGDQALAFGALLGVQIGLIVYLIAMGLALRDGAMLRLAGLSAAFVVYVIVDRGFLETLVPASYPLARISGLASTFLIFAAWLSFESCYLRIGAHWPRLGRVISLVTILLVLCAFEAGREAALNIRFIRLYSAYIGIGVMALVIGLAVLMMWRDWRRSAAFLICWLPAILGGAARLALDAVPGTAAYPVVVNIVYFSGAFSILIFGVVTSLDIQARERRLRAAAEASEARFRSFADSASDSFWETDATGRIVQLTGRAEDIAELSLGAQMLESLGRHANEAARADLDRLRQCVREEKPFRGVMLSLQNAAGELRYILLSGSPSFDDQGRFRGHRGIVTDVTDDRIMAERQAQQQKMAALGQLAGGIAHEINNLLHPIINLSRRVRDSLRNDESRYQMDIIVDAGVRANEIVASVLTSARPSLHRSQTVLFREALQRAIEAVRPIIPGSVKLEADLGELEGPPVPAGEVFQVLSNLVTNAVHALQGVGRIRVSLACEDGAIVLSVSDDGHGMDAETQRQALEPFFTTKAREGGTGLGLPLVYGIVNGWGGSMEIRSEPGRGTEIVIRVPEASSLREMERGHNVAA